MHCWGGAFAHSSTGLTWQGSFRLNSPSNKAGFLWLQSLVSLVLAPFCLSGTTPCAVCLRMVSSKAFASQTAQRKHGKPTARHSAYTQTTSLEKLLSIATLATWTLNLRPLQWCVAATVWVGMRYAIGFDKSGTHSGLKPFCHQHQNRSESMPTSKGHWQCVRSAGVQL